VAAGLAVLMGRSLIQMAGFMAAVAVQLMVQALLVHMAQLAQFVSFGLVLQGSFHQLIQAMFKWLINYI
jgi:hypothetical protein